MSAVLQWLDKPTNYASVLIAAADILIVAFVIYNIIMLVKGTRAWQIMWGLGIFFVLVFVSDLLHLRALNWLLRTFLPLGPVALVILFFPEIRHALEELGRIRFLSAGLSSLGREDLTNLVDELSLAVREMSRSSIGALIVIERNVGLDDVISNGRRMDALVSADLVRTIFYPGSPLHDGAIVIRGNKVICASCTLPLSDSPRIGTMLRTRHKAALGVSEQSDAVVLVVSEETGTISMSVDGTLIRGLSADGVNAKLLDLLQVEETKDNVQQIKQTMSAAFSKVKQSSSVGRKENV